MIKGKKAKMNPGNRMRFVVDMMLLLCVEDVEAAGYSLGISGFTANMYAEASSDAELLLLKKEVSELFEQFDKQVSIRSIPELIQANNELAQSDQVLCLLAVF